jgi:hypothetical protein
MEVVSVGVGNGKGALLVNLRAFVEKEHGADAWDKLVLVMPEADQKMLTGLPLASGWYPVGPWNRALRAYVATQRIASTGEAAAIIGIARYIADRDLNTFFKVLLRARSPEFILARAGSLWDRYFDVGSAGAEEVEKRSWRAWVDAPQGEDKGPGVLTCRYGVVGWLMRALELSGVKPKIAETHCRYRGAPRCEYGVKW